MGRWYRGVVDLNPKLIWKKSLNKLYWVSERGDVVNASTGFTLSPTLSSDGYCKLGVITGQVSVHRLVVEAFTGEIPEGLQVNHLDGNKQNNHISNLELCTAQENTLHAYRTGLAKGRAGEENAMNQYPESLIKVVYSLIRKGLSNMDISKITNIPWRYVSLLRKGERWSHLFEQEGMKVTLSTGSLPFHFSKCVYILNVCLSTNLMNKDIAERFGINPSTVSRIRSGNTWKALRVHLEAYG